mgnify:CR=1 FL=1
MKFQPFVNRIAAVCLLLGSSAAFAANVGYYDMDLETGNADQIPPITAAGHTPVDMPDLTPAALAAIDILFVQNPDNNAYGAEYVAALADIEAAVSAGLVLVMHDRFVTDAETILPAGAGFDIIRDDVTDTDDIDILNDTTTVTDGPGGLLTDTSLDGGNLSSHGFAVIGSLPEGGMFILSRPDQSQIVTFSYAFGTGGVIYSSIPLDFYLGGAGNNPPADNMRDIYAVNVLAYASEGNFASDGIARFHVTKIFSDGSTDDVDVNLTCTTGIPLSPAATIAGGDPVGVTFVMTLVEEGANCEVTETNVPAGYTAILNGGDGCAWTNVKSGFRVCEIANWADPATFTVNKEWVIVNDGGDQVHGYVHVEAWCTSEIAGGYFDAYSGNWYISDYLGDGDSLVATVDTTAGPTSCWAMEYVVESGVESEGDCGPRQIAAGGASSCTFVNTVFFEGIPTLSQYGMAIMALLMLGMGFVGFRRFV